MLISLEDKLGYCPLTGRAGLHLIHLRPRRWVQVSIKFNIYSNDRDNNLWTLTRTLLKQFLSFCSSTTHWCQCRWLVKRCDIYKKKHFAQSTTCLSLKLRNNYGFYCFSIVYFIILKLKHNILIILFLQNWNF